MRKVFINPVIKGADHADGGVRRVVEAMVKWLPEFGWEVCESVHQSDLINCHGTMMTPDPSRPFVSSCHGLYWAQYPWDRWAHDANRAVVESLIRADGVTCPSEWVREAVVRGVLCDPVVVHHGIDAASMKVVEPGDFVLWNKARHDLVSDPAPLDRIAKLMPQTHFITTFGTPAPNTKVIGAVNHETMMEVVQHAGVFLATCRETFGIGTLEALAFGVPVVGWDYGGQREIIIQNETGVLVPLDDYGALAEAINYCQVNRARMGEAARQDALQRWGWADKIRLYGELFDQVLEGWQQPRPKVSVIVTLHNLEGYVKDTLDSLQRQTLRDWEAIVVDDASTDGGPSIVEEYAKSDPRFKLLHTPKNLKLSGAKNFGASHASGKFLMALDADDMLDELALDVLSRALEADPWLHIAYGHLDTVSDDGQNQQRNSWPPDQFSWYGQVSHLNQLPYCAMMKRKVWELSGGWRERCWRAEDAEFWTRVSSLGFRIGKVTQRSTLIYRFRTNSKSKGEPGDGDWTLWFPWRVCGDAKFAEAQQLHKVGPTDSVDWPGREITPFGAQGLPPRSMRFWNVPHREDPFVTVVIPVGPGHEEYLVDALDSVFAQTMTNWECVVVNDTGKFWDGKLPRAGFEWAKVLDSEGPPKGAGHARNRGIKAARGQTISFLDADDCYMPGFLESTLRAWIDNGGLIYTDWLAVTGKLDEVPVEHQTTDFVIGAALKEPQHGMNVLLSREDALSVLFDETMPAWEDWDWEIALQTRDICSTRVNSVQYIYRVGAGGRRKIGEEVKKQLQLYLEQKWADYYEGTKQMCKPGCSKPKAAKSMRVTMRLAPPQTVLAQGLEAEQGTWVRYSGKRTATFSLRGRSSGRTYRFGNNSSHAERVVRDEDLEAILSYMEGGNKVMSAIPGRTSVEVGPNGPGLAVMPPSKETEVRVQQLAPDAQEVLSASSPEELRARLSGREVRDISLLFMLESQGARRPWVLQTLQTAFSG